MLLSLPSTLHRNSNYIQSLHHRFFSILILASTNIILLPLFHFYTHYTIHLLYYTMNALCYLYTIMSDSQTTTNIYSHFLLLFSFPYIIVFHLIFNALCHLSSKFDSSYLKRFMDSAEKNTFSFSFCGNKCAHLISSGKLDFASTRNTLGYYHAS